MKSQLTIDIELALNCACIENESDTPDYILAEYLIHCLNAFNQAVNSREIYKDSKKENANEV